MEIGIEPKIFPLESGLEALSFRLATHFAKRSGVGVQIEALRLTR